MDEEFKKLHDYLTQNKYYEANLLVQEVSSTFKKELPDTVLDFYVLNIFDETYGFISFINNAVDKKVFTKAVVECLEIIYSLVNNSIHKVEKYTPHIRRMCLKIVLTVNSKVEEKNRALELLQLVLEKSNYYPEEYLSRKEIFSKLSRTYETATGKVLGNVIKSLGILIRIDSYVINEPENLYKTILSKMQYLIKENSESPIKECFSFLSDFLHSYADVDVAIVYGYIKQRMSQDMYRKGSHREGMHLLVKHSTLFEQQIYNDAQFWQNTLTKWLDMGGDNRKAGFVTLDMIYNSLSKSICIANGQNKILFATFWNKFVDDIFYTNFHGYKLQVSIRGFGYFAKAAKVFFTKTELSRSFYDFMNKIEQTYLIEFSGVPDGLDYLPDYIQSLSNIIQQLDDVTEYEVGILQQATVLVIKLLPQLPLGNQNIVVSATFMAYNHVRTYKNRLSKQYLLNVMREGIICSCSQAIVNTDIEYDKNMVTYKNYLPFWENLINKHKGSLILDMDDNIVAALHTEIFDEFMATLFYLIDRLNLNTCIRENFSELTDPKVTLEAVRVKDFNIFVNAVDFYVEILKDVNKTLFKKWMPMFLNTVMMKSKKHPLVSGFYKLLAVGLKVCNDLNFFEEKRLTREDIRICYETVSNLVNNIVLKVKLYKDDLKISCIQVILSTPVSIISNLMSTIAPVMISLFSLGRSNLSLVEMGIDTLERWCKEIKQDDFDQFLRQVLPCLDAFLSSKSISEKFDSNAVKVRKTRQAMTRKKIVTLTDGDLFKVQKRILSFIGGLSHDMCRLLVEGNYMVGDTTAYSKELHLSVPLKFTNLKIDLYIEKLLPRIIELSLYCSERKLRINACEVLHAMILVFLGKANAMNEQLTKDLHGILKKIIDALLVLGCDSDITVQKILRPLMLQIMHWYSSPSQKAHSHQAIVIETVLDGVTQTADSAVRDFSCICIKEFIEWSIKQSSRTSLAKDPINVQIILRKIKFFSSHSDPSKRFAAALIFNNIYRILREENYLFEVYWIELLYCFVLNLSFIDDYDEYDCFTQVSSSLDHLQRGFVEKSYIFNKRNRGVNRKLPPNFADTFLVDVACFLLKQTGSAKRHCREECFKLFLIIAPLCEKGDLKGFIDYYESIHGADWMQNLYFHNQSLEMGTANMEMLIKWMSDFQCLLDANIFFQKCGIPLENSNLLIFFRAADVFYELIYPNNLQKLSQDNMNFFLTSMDKDNFFTLKNQIVKKYIVYFTSGGLLSNQEHWDLLTVFIFENNDLLSEDIHSEEVNSFLGNIKDNQMEAFLSSLERYLASNSLEDCDLNGLIPFKQRQLLKGLLLLKKSNLNNKLNLENYTRNALKNLFNKFTDYSSIAVNLQSTAKEYCQLKIELSLRNGDFLTLIEWLCNNKLIMVSQKREEIEFGRYLFDTFKVTVIAYVINNFNIFFQEIVSRKANVLYFIEEILIYLSINKGKFTEANINEIINTVLFHWPVYEEFYEKQTYDRIKGLKLLEKILVLLDEKGEIHDTNINESSLWIVDCLDLTKFSLLPHETFEYLSCCIAALPIFLRNDKDAENVVKKLVDIENDYLSNISPDMQDIATLFLIKSFRAALLAKSKHLFAFSSRIYALINPKNDFSMSDFCKLFMSTSTKETQLQMLRLLYEICMDLSKYNLEIRYKLTKEVLINLIRYAEYEIFENFFIENIQQIMFPIRRKSTNHVECAEESMSYILVTILFSRINTDNIFNATCPITSSACSNVKDGKELVKEVMKEAAQFLKEETGDQNGDNFQNWNRLSKCECYNALISVMCNVQKDPIFYDMLFRRELNQNNMLWKNIVDDTKDYTFPVDFEEIPQRRENLAAIRTEYRAKRGQDDPSERYIQTNNIMLSTLNEDIVKYDFSRTILRSQPYDVILRQNGGNLIEMQVEIDKDELNTHECMVMLCGLFQHLHDKNIYGATNGGVPKFVESIRKDLESVNTSRNAKLFLIKAIENSKQLFKPYANALFTPIMRNIVDGTAGKNINYFVADLIEMLTFWAVDLDTIEADQSATDLVNFLIKNVNTDRTDIKKYHIDLIKFFVEQWKNHIEVPKDYLLEQLTQLAHSERVDPIIHISSIFLANDLPPWKDVSVFIKKLTDILLKNKSKVICRSCAEAIGTALHYVKEHENVNVLSDFTSFLTKKMRQVDKDNKLEYLQVMMKRYPEIADGFINNLIIEYNNYLSLSKGICLKIFLERIDHLHICIDFPSIKLENLISETSDHLKIIGLEIIRKTVPVIQLSGSACNINAKLTLKKEHFLNLLNTLSKFISSDNNICRNVVYDIFIDIYENDMFGNQEDIMNICKDVLLQGLVDHNSEIEEKLYSFWMKVMPTTTAEKFIYLLKNMYKSSTENYYLGYYINFLLNELSPQEDYEEGIFPHDLADCKYTEYRIKDNWRERHTSLAPMFAESYRSQDFEVDFGTSTQLEPNMLRATNYDMEFEPTLQPSLLDLEKKDIISSAIESGMADDGHDEEGVFKKPLPVKLRNVRFYKDRTKYDRKFAKRATEERTKEEEKRKDIVKRRQQEVTIYRSYRLGDFPDIKKLTVSDVISPMKMLLKHDNQLAKIFYTILFDSITNKLKDDKEDFIENIMQGVNSIFENSLIYDPNLMGALLDVVMYQRNVFSFPADVIAKVSLNSGLLSSGALLLEEYLISLFDDEAIAEPPAKRNKGRSDSSEVINCWTKLADMYKELEDWDLVRAVFLYKMNCDKTVISAIDAESQGSWINAQDYYSQVIKQDQSSERRSFYYESYYKCFAELSNWHGLSQSIEDTICEENIWQEFWEDDWYQQKLLPWYITAELRKALDENDDRSQNIFISQLNKLLLDSEKLAYMKQHFSEEIAFLYLLTENYDKVMYFILNNIELFLSNWSNLSPLLTSLRTKKLVKLQNTLEIYNFITKYNNFNRLNKNSILNDMCKYWLKAYEEKVSSIVPTETKTIYRTQCLSILKSKFESEEIHNRLNKIQFQLEMNLANTAVNMKNFYVTRKYLRRNNLYEDTDTREGIKYAQVLCKVVLLKIPLLKESEQIDNLVEIWSQLGKYLNRDVLASNVDLYLSTHTLIYTITQKLSHTLLNSVLTDENQNDINQLSQGLSSYTSDDIGNYSFKGLQNALEHVKEKIDLKDKNSVKSLGDAHFQLASFVIENSSHSRADLVLHILRAMRYGSPEARQHFPCLLDIENLGSTHRLVFLEEAEKIPNWMFIQWIPQLLANLDTLNMSVVFSVLEKVAKTYPQSMMYAYRLSKQKFKDEFITNNGDVINRLDDLLLSDPLVDKFLNALASVGTVKTILMHHIKELQKACKSVDKFGKKMNELKSLCGEDIRSLTQVTSLKGSIFREIIGLIKKELLCLGNITFDPEVINKKLVLLKKKLPSGDVRKPLQDCSPWLENFSDNEMNMNLEIPGQYKGNKKPLLQYHVKICGFSSELQKLDSLRSPLRLTIIGSDAKEYPFLVKLGEDLRQDQRIEQMFELMNSIFDSDSVCREKRLNIRTYQVIPLTDVLGLIEWVPNTVTYKELLNRTIPKFTNISGNVVLEYRKRYLAYRGKGKPEPDDYMKALVRNTPESTTPVYKYLVNQIPSDIFRQAIWKLSIDAESFVALRTKFISSHAVTCIANWIMGISDRHLSNSLISLSKGETVDIDFGYAFGAGIQILAVPEVVPFRLTPHIIELMQPLKQHGLIEETMIHVLRALRNNHKSLLSTVSVFIKEPSLEWMEFASSENNLYNWSPEKKLEHVKRKLEGANPVDIMVEELVDRIWDRNWLNARDAYIEHVKGRENENIRARLTGNLSVEDQVRCLLDHATDTNLSCRLFDGFESWI